MKIFSACSHTKKQAIVLVLALSYVALWQLVYYEWAANVLQRKKKHPFCQYACCGALCAALYCTVL